MMKRSLFALLVLLLLVAPAAAQDDTCGLPTRLESGRHGTALQDIRAHDPAGASSPATAVIPTGELFQINSEIEPQCIDGALWWPFISMNSYGWLPETSGGQYVVEPYSFTPAAPILFDNVPLNPPVMTDIQTPLPTVTPAENPAALDVPFVSRWDWEAFTQDNWYHPPDPLAIRLPAQYAGDFPSLPVDLNSVHFVQDANLNDAQFALLAQNGFVVVPSGYQQFDDVYRSYNEDWDHLEGKAQFVTTDALLHALFLVYQNALMFLEVSDFYGDVADFLMKGYEAAEAQYEEAIGTPLEDAARKAAIYYAVPLMLMAQGEDSYVEGYEQTPVYGDGEQKPSSVIAAADSAIIAAAQPMVDMALAGEGRLPVPMLDDYTEDFSQYQPRSYYAGNPLLESYFLAMMWLGRITFTAKSLPDTQTGLLVLRALQSTPEGYERWQHAADTIEFLVGPVDDYGPKDYAPIAEAVFGAGISTTSLSDPDNLLAFGVQVAQLPPPRVNSIPIPVGAISEEELVEKTRGFRLFGQRFTFDGYVMQQLIYPAVGTADMSRTLPLGLDVPAVLGSDVAYALADAADTTGFANYTEHVASLREEVSGMDANDWLQNLYGGWLWTLQPLAIRDAALVPPMMQTDAWKRKDLTSFLGSYTELKHATLLYAEQPMGGLGGGGMEPPVISFSQVEPNPLVFARIAVVATLLNRGLAERGYIETGGGQYSPADSLGSATRSLATLAARLAEMARKEVAGEPLSHDESYFLQENFGQALWYIRYEVEQWITNPPETTALVADVASNAASGEALELGIGSPDLIYAITNSPYGLQVTRGAVYSYYEFPVPIDGRMTDDEWRQQVASGETPARPTWIDLYYSK